MPLPTPLCPQIVSSASTDLQDYTYYFVPAPWLSVKLLRLLQCYPPPGNSRAEPGEGLLRPLNTAPSALLAPAPAPWASDALTALSFPGAAGRGRSLHCGWARLLCILHVRGQPLWVFETVF